MKQPKQQRGVALITALVIVAIAIMLASAMLWQVHLSQRRSSNILFFDQGWQYLRGAEDWATWILNRDRQQSQIDHLNEAWTTPLAGLAIEGGQLSGQLTDLQGRFNLNNLAVNPQIYGEQFTHLLTALGITAPIAGAVVDWVDKDREQSDLGGAEDGYYLGLNPAYRTANDSFESVTELRMIKGVTPEIYAALLPHITALPVTGQATRINVNTATAPVLASLFTNITAAPIQTILEQRSSRPYKKAADFNSSTGRENTDIKVTVKSDYFLLHTQVNIGSLRISMYSLLHRGQGGNTQAEKRALGTL